MFAECCQNPRTNYRCHLHENNMISLFCSHKQCLQPLCVQCLEAHNKIHSNLHLGQPKLIEMSKIQNHCQGQISRELAMIEDFKKSNHKPAEYIYKCIDNFFHGSTSKREKVLQEQQKHIVTEFDAHFLVRLIEEGHTYELPDRFEQKYFDFLDKLLSKVARRQKEKEFLKLK